MSKKMELLLSNIEVRADFDDNEAMIVEGIVNVPGVKSKIMTSGIKKFTEIIKPGAFAKAISNAARIDFLEEHDKSKVLASTVNDSLTIEERSDGVHMRAKISPTSWGKDCFTLIKDGIIKNMSFGFIPIKDNWKIISKGVYERTIEEMTLTEVSAVKRSVYDISSICARSEEFQDTQIPDEIIEEEEMNENVIKILSSIAESLSFLVESKRNESENKEKDKETKTKEETKEETKTDEKIDEKEKEVEDNKDKKENKEDNEEKDTKEVEEKEEKVDEKENSEDEKRSEDISKSFDFTDLLNKLDGFMEVK